MNLFNGSDISVGSIVFLEPIFLYLAFVTLFIPILLLRASAKKQAFHIGNIKDLQNAGFKGSFVYYIKNTLIVLSYIMFFILFANPHYTEVKEKVTKDGIDIVVALDVSKSMEAQDLQPNRIGAAKNVISEFVGEIETDRLSLVVFAGKPYSSIPLTYDYTLISEIISELNTDTINQNVSGLDGTAIGDALLLGSKLLEPLEEEDTEREKIIIILTDGDANRGVDPILATKSLLTDDIKVYTIGVGSKEGGLIEIQNGPFTQRQRIPALKEDTLREIASISGGKFYRATDNDSLEKIFEEIATLEKTEIETEIERNYVTAYSPFVIILVFLLVLLFSVQYIYKS